MGTKSDACTFPPHALSVHMPRLCYEPMGPAAEDRKLCYRAQIWIKRNCQISILSIFLLQLQEQKNCMTA